MWGPKYPNIISTAPTRLNAGAEYIGYGRGCRFAIYRIDGDRSFMAIGQDCVAVIYAPCLRAMSDALNDYEPMEIDDADAIYP